MFNDVQLYAIPSQTKVVCITKAVFYGELDAGKRTRGGQRKRYKDVLKATLKSCGVPHNTWESTAMDRALWRRTCHVGLHEFEKKRCDALREKRLRLRLRLPSLHQTLSPLCVVSVDDNVHRGSVCSATTVHAILTEVEIRRTDGSLHTIHTKLLNYVQLYAIPSRTKVV